jgi:ABC-2 type transport system permease protein
MKAAVKAELRKLLTVRSTYFIIAFLFLLLGIFGFYVSGWHMSRVDLLNPEALAHDVTDAVNTISVFIALIAVLLFTHEYRYNTIMYTLTSSNSRSKVLAAKIIVIGGFALIFTALFAVLSPLISLLGIHAHHLTLAHQTLHYSNLAWRTLFFGWGYAMVGLVLAALIRSQVGTIAALFIAPSTVEGLLGLLLKKNVVYLPFSSLHAVIGIYDNQGSNISPSHAALVFLGYLLVAWAIAWMLFLRRDAN